MSLTVQFGKKMRDYRDDRPVNVIADRVGCGRRAIENMEAGRTLPRLQVYVRLCRAYKLTLPQRAELDEIASGIAAEPEGE